nr:hypothetical protein [Buttiauxella sp. A2-C1_F]
MTDEVIAKSFDGSNFGRTDFRTILAETVMKRAAGYHSGGTATYIATELGLLSPKNQSATKLGLTFAFHHYYKQNVRDAISKEPTHDNPTCDAMHEAVRRAPLTKPQGLSPEWQAYFDAVSPLHVAGLITALEQAQSERDKFNFAHKEWNDKTEWVQKESTSGRFRFQVLGMHRADVMTRHIDELEARTLSFALPDPSSKAFWGGTGKNETFYPSTYKLWLKEAIERAGIIAGVKIEVR